MSIAKTLFDMYEINRDDVSVLLESMKYDHHVSNSAIMETITLVFDCDHSYLQFDLKTKNGHVSFTDKLENEIRITHLKSSKLYKIVMTGCDNKNGIIIVPETKIFYAENRDDCLEQVCNHWGINSLFLFDVYENGELLSCCDV